MFKIFKSRSILSLLLVFAMTLSLLPGTAFATDTDTGEHIHIEDCSHEEDASETTEESGEETAPSEETGEETTPTEEPVMEEESEEPVSEEEVSQTAYSGTVGESSVLWSYNPSNGQLIITGSGGCDTFRSADDQPWAHLRTEIREVWFNTPDALSISNLAYWFDGCTELRIAEVPYTTPIIGERAFADSPHLEELRIYYYDEDNFEIVQSAFVTALPSAITVFLISEQQATVHEIRTYNWALDNRTVGLCDVYSYRPLLGCSLTGCNCASCDWYYHYEPASATQHQQQVKCTTCDARFGLEIEKLTARNKKIDVDIIDIENTDIVEMVRDYGLSPDMLMDLLEKMQKNPLPGVVLPLKEEPALEE